MRVAKLVAAILGLGIALGLLQWLLKSARKEEPTGPADEVAQRDEAKPAPKAKKPAGPAEAPKARPDHRPPPTPKRPPPDKPARPTTPVRPPVTSKPGQREPAAVATKPIAVQPRLIVVVETKSFPPLAADPASRSRPLPFEHVGRDGRPGAGVEFVGRESLAAAFEQFMAESPSLLRAVGYVLAKTPETAPASRPAQTRQAQLCLFVIAGRRGRSYVWGPRRTAIGSHPTRGLKMAMVRMGVFANDFLCFLAERSPENRLVQVSELFWILPPPELRLMLSALGVGSPREGRLRLKEETVDGWPQRYDMAEGVPVLYDFTPQPPASQAYQAIAVSKALPTVLPKYMEGLRTTRRELTEKATTLSAGTDLDRALLRLALMDDEWSDGQLGRVAARGAAFAAAVDRVRAGQAAWRALPDKTPAPRGEFSPNERFWDLAGGLGLEEHQAKVPPPSSLPKTPAHPAARGPRIGWPVADWEDARMKTPDHPMRRCCVVIKRIQVGKKTALAGVGFGPKARDKTDPVYQRFKEQHFRAFSDGVAKDKTVGPPKTIKQKFNNVEYERTFALKGGRAATVMVTIKDGRCAAYWFLGSNSCFPAFLKHLDKVTIQEPPESP